MAGRGRPPYSSTKEIEQYSHPDKTRSNNPPVGLVTAANEPEATRRKYAYDPHLDPRLEWAGKTEHASFEVSSVPLHVHERIDPKAIIEAVKKGNGAQQDLQLPLFETVRENPPLRDALDFYKHPHGWSNRLVAGDSLLVMNSLIEKEGLAGQVQMIYFDPPYGIKYGSNFQPFVNKREVKDKDSDLTAEPETIRAFRDTWELGIHSYLSYLRDRLLLCRELLSESGSCFVQISNENLHFVRNLMDEVFGSKNFVELIVFKKKGMPLKGQLLEGNSDFIVWYARDKDRVKFHHLFSDTIAEGDSHWNYVELSDGSRRKMTSAEINNHKLLPTGADIYQLSNLYPAGVFDTGLYDVVFKGKRYKPPPGRCWKTHKDGFERLIKANRIQAYDDGATLRYVLKLSDYPVSPIANVWTDTAPPADKRYVVQTAEKVVQRCMLMTTDPGDLVFDPTAGSATTAFVAETWGRRWITCDTSRVAVTIAKQRLMTAVYDYFKLAHPSEGVASGFLYKVVPHVTLKSIANAEPPGHEVLRDRPAIDSQKARVSGPFTVEAVPSATVQPLQAIPAAATGDSSISRSGATGRITTWCSELLSAGIRGQAKQSIHFARIEALAGTRWIHASGEALGPSAERIVISFGPEHAPLEQKQVELAWEEARQLSPKPSMIVFASFEFDPEAAKDIDALTKEKTGMTFLKVKMNNDLLTEDLKKSKSSNQSFWLMGQPDVELSEIRKGEHRGKMQVEVHGFDYYNTKTGAVESGDTSKIAMWMLDTDYDGRSLYPRQVFFPMAGKDEGWAKLAKNLKAEIDGDLMEAYRGTVSLPFELGGHGRVAVKIVDDRGIESLKVIAAG